jgi:hypothetical protein
MLSIEEIRDSLEMIIDRHSLSEIVKAIAFIHNQLPNPGINQDDFSELQEICEELEWKDLKEELSNICHEKAQHLESVWQDKPMADSWLGDDKAIQKIKNPKNSIKGDILPS